MSRQAINRSVVQIKKEWYLAAAVMSIGIMAALVSFGQTVGIGVYKNAETRSVSPVANGDGSGPLKADYQFLGNLNSSVGTAPPLTELIGAGANSFVSDSVDGFARQTFRFATNGGVAINSIGAIVPENAFSIAILFKLDDISQRRRLFDLSGGTAADWLYLLDGRLEPENTSNTPMLNNAYTQIVVVRTGTGQVNYYRDGILRFSDTDGGGPIPFGIRFFQDVINNPLQSSAGNVARVRLWDTPLTQNEVYALDRVPETPTGALPVLFFSTRNGTFEHYRMNPDGSSQVRLTNNAFTEFAGKFSPNGQKVVYMRRETGTDPYQIWIMNADGTNQTRLTNTATNDISAGWRPDGQKIIFSRCNQPGCDLYTMNPDGTNQQPITAANTAGDEDQAQFTPDGTKLVFICSDSSLGNYQICVTNADGTNRQLITNTVSPIVSQIINISPDGQKLAFVRNSTTVNGLPGWDIYTMNIDGTNVVNLTNNATQDTTPIWSPDGTQIMFAAYRAGGQSDIWIMNADGSNPIRLMRNSADDRLSDWFRPPASGVEVSGRVFTSDGRGLRNATVKIAGPGGFLLSAVTSSFGYYRFDGIPVGPSYTITVNSRSYRFNPRQVTVTGALTDVDFVGLE
ncbi:MAG: PD40 domain-containing protein [Acidobacteriota bacterium]|nr:MAG: PD40 domain-containing protein [Acidobacteriota bacterium]